MTLATSTGGEAVETGEASVRLCPGMGFDIPGNDHDFGFCSLVGLGRHDRPVVCPGGGIVGHAALLLLKGGLR